MAYNIEIYLNELRDYILGKTYTLIDEKIFDDIINSINIEYNYDVTEEDFIRSLSNITNKFNTEIVNGVIFRQKNYFNDVLNEFVEQDKSLEDCYIRRLNNDDFWKSRVDKVVDKIREYIDINFSKTNKN